jgi:hypothetical protein
LKLVLIDLFEVVKLLYGPELWQGSSLDFIANTRNLKYTSPYEFDNP